MPLPCEERTTLLLEYSRLAKVYYELVDHLHMKMGTMTSANYFKHYEVAEEARLDSERARVVMEVHIRNHGC